MQLPPSVDVSCAVATLFLFILEDSRYSVIASSIHRKELNVLAVTNNRITKNVLPSKKNLLRQFSPINP